MSNDGNIKTSILLIILKYVVVGYSNGNESFTGRLFSNYGLLNILFHVFSISHLKCFSRHFCQKVYEETFLFQLKFNKSISRCSIFQKIRMSNFVIQKWRPFEYKIKSWKICPFWDCFFRNKKCWHLNFSSIKYFGNDSSFLVK